VNGLSGPSRVSDAYLGIVARGRYNLADDGAGVVNAVTASGSVYGRAGLSDLLRPIGTS
jgi:hypothetical protein